MTAPFPVYRIEDKKPVYPCWMWHVTMKHWWRCPVDPLMVEGNQLAPDDYWSPDAPTPPSSPPERQPEPTMDELEAADMGGAKCAGQHPLQQWRQPEEGAKQTNGVMQTKFGKDGNCFDACIATLLNLPLGSVDYFRGEDTWYADLQRWLAPRGLAYVEIDLGDPSPFYRFPLPVRAIAGGPSPRGVEGGHACIVELNGWDKRIVHDPHPDGGGLLSINTIGFLVRVAPPPALPTERETETPRTEVVPTVADRGLGRELWDNDQMTVEQRDYAIASHVKAAVDFALRNEREQIRLDAMLEVERELSSLRSSLARAEGERDRNAHLYFCAKQSEIPELNMEIASLRATLQSANQQLDAANERIRILTSE